MGARSTAALVWRDPRGYAWAREGPGAGSLGATLPLPGCAGRAGERPERAPGLGGQSWGGGRRRPQVCAGWGREPCWLGEAGSGGGGGPCTPGGKVSRRERSCVCPRAGGPCSWRGWCSPRGHCWGRSCADPRGSAGVWFSLASGVGAPGCRRRGLSLWGRK